MVLIKQKKSLIPSCDVDSLEKLKQLVKTTHDVKGIGAYKIGFELVIPFGIKEVIKAIRKITDLPIIYDHQKAGTDIPEMGEKFIKSCQGVDAVILFPQAGPVTEKAWINSAKKLGMKIIVGGEMTHEGYLQESGGFMINNAPSKIYDIAASMGVTDFVIPGNKPNKAIEYRKIIEKNIKKPIFYSPGLVAQGGDISELAQKLDSWHAIIGRAIYGSDNIKKTTEGYAKALN